MTAATLIAARNPGDESERGTGRTTRQMLGAPLGAVFVWCSWNLDYPKSLARSLGRSDLLILSPEAVNRGSLRGIRRPVVIDHAEGTLTSGGLADIALCNGKPL